MVQINIFLLPPPLCLGCHPVLILRAEGFHDPSDSGLHWPSRRIYYISKSKQVKPRRALLYISLGSFLEVSVLLCLHQADIVHHAGDQTSQSIHSEVTEITRDLDWIPSATPSPVFSNSDWEGWWRMSLNLSKVPVTFCSDQSWETGSGANEWNLLQ